jgi:hypothetical protein
MICPLPRASEVSALRAAGGTAIGIQGGADGSRRGRGGAGHETAGSHHAGLEWHPDAVRGRGAVALYDRRQLPSPRKAPALEVQRRHAWLRGCPDEPHTLIAVRDDATKRLLYAQPWPAESTVAVMTALRTVFTRDGLPVALYTDRAGWAFHTPQAGGRVDRTRLTQVGRALAQSRICINSRCVTISCQCGRAPYPVVETKGLDEIQPPIPGSTVHGVANSAALPAHPCRSVPCRKPS